MESPINHSDSNRAKPSQMPECQFYSHADLRGPSWCHWAPRLPVETSQYPVWTAQKWLWTGASAVSFQFHFLGRCERLSDTRIRDTTQTQIKHVPYCPDVTFLSRYGSHPWKKNWGREIAMDEVSFKNGEGDAPKFLLDSCPRNILGLLETGEKSGDHPSTAPQLPHIFASGLFPKYKCRLFLKS